MAQKSIPVLPGCTLYRRNLSSKWQVRIKLENGEWYRRTTGKWDVEEARDQAVKQYYEARLAAKHNLPQQTRRFSGVAKTVQRELAALRGTAHWRKAYDDYLSALRRHLVPYFGAYRLDNLRERYDGYIDHLTGELGRAPAESTLRTHFAALNMVFDKAKQHGYASDHQLPKLMAKGRKGERRPAFEADEYLALITKLRAWCSKPQRMARSTEIRQLLYDYVIVLANTGIRHGTEMMNIKWRHVYFSTDKGTGDRYLRLNVWNEKGRAATKRQRQVVARFRTVDALKRIQSRHPKLSEIEFEELLRRKVDEHVFVLSDGTQPHRLDQLFKRFLKEHGFLVGRDSDKDRSLYSFRHYYATQELTRATPTPIDVLAMQMGTSIAMIERHYSHLKLDDVAKKLAGERFDDRLAKLASDADAEVSGD